MSFCYAAVYQVQAECLTPLRTGGADGDVEQVLRRKDGRAFIQGTSLAGAMRVWLTEQTEYGLADALFGSQDRAGQLIVSDALFDSRSNQATRPRLRIDSVSATGELHGKFDMAHMEAGSSLRFNLVWQGQPEQKQELDAVETLLGAMHTGAICLGAQRSNGFGRLSLTVRCRRFDLKIEKDRQAWLEDDWAAWQEQEWKDEPISLPAPQDAARVRFTVVGSTGSILIKDAPVVLPGAGRDGKVETYMPNLFENGKAVLPGSSVKGAVRARAEYIARTLGIDPSVVENGFGRMAKDGDNGLPGLVHFEEGVLQERLPAGSRPKITRIRIDRFTGGVQRQALFREEPLSADLTLTITAPEKPALCGLLIYALRDLGLGLYPLGSGWAIGRGKIEITEIRISAPGKRQAALRFDSRGKITLEDHDALVKEWLNKLKEAPHA
ncbi:MAG: hypothetical protein HDT27_07455 [Subdoligranulum sp.]|nr:hypothetical protein [Subdoligranulum sp.]